MPSKKKKATKKVSKSRKPAERAVAKSARGKKSSPKARPKRAKWIAPKSPHGIVPPYLHRVGARHGVDIWIVDGPYIRKNIDEEFSNFGTHFSIEEIPLNEIWLDREAHPDEQRFFIAHAIVERRVMAAGKDYDTARRLASDAEFKLREQTHDATRVALGKGLPEPDRVHVRLRKELLDGTAVWMVNGRLVRSVFDIEFTEGGHEYVYEFVPHGQVWVDDDVTEEEIGYVILHELHERNLMAKGWTYDDAHDSASKIELHCRRHPHLLHGALAQEGWE